MFCEVYSTGVESVISRGNLMLESLEKLGSGRIVLAYLRALYIIEYLACQLFAQLYSPLVKTVDVPKESLNKYFVFVHGNQSPQ